MFYLVSAICLLNGINTANQTRGVTFQMTGDVQNLQLSNPNSNRTLTFSPEGNNTVITAYENGRVVERVSIDQNASPERVNQLATSMRNGTSAPAEDTQSVSVTIDEGETLTPEKDEKDKKDEENKKKDDKNNKKDKKKDDKKDKSTSGVKTNMACVGLLCAVLYNLV